MQPTTRAQPLAGTSAGAAVMSRKMLTGNELLGDTAYYETFKKILSGNIDIQKGLGLLDSAIMNTKYEVRSTRYEANTKYF